MKESKALEKYYITQMLKNKSNNRISEWGLFNPVECNTFHCPLLEESKYVNGMFICNGYNLAKR